VDSRQLAMNDLSHDVVRQRDQVLVSRWTPRGFAHGESLPRTDGPCPFVPRLCLARASSCQRGGQPWVGEVSAIFRCFCGIWSWHGAR
jgi:hypothetical protein